MPTPFYIQVKVVDFELVLSMRT